MSDVREADLSTGRSPSPRAEPVAPEARIASMDALRGMALLGILAMNIEIFAWPDAGYENPRYSGGTGFANVASWAFSEVVFSGKMMSLFSMLFGAGLVLMTERTDARGASLRGVYYRRILWLLAFGLIHAYLIWHGDILVSYALCGLLLYLFRRKRPRTLVVIGSVMIAIGACTIAGLDAFGGFARQIAAQVETLRAAGKTPRDWQVEIARAWKDELRDYMDPRPEEIGREIAIYRGGYLGILRHRAPLALAFETWIFAMYLFWSVGGRMLLGMALMRLGVFTASRSSRFYRNLALVGYGVGLPLTLLGVIHVSRSGYDVLRAWWAVLALDAGTVPLALGHAGVLLGIYRSGAWRAFTRRLAAVGRMALTNYLMQSLICTTLFYGYGLGLYARLSRPLLWGVVGAIWAIQLFLSPLWLRAFRYGPAEWLWRALTYGTLPPFAARPAALAMSRDRPVPLSD
jgi:uncharacterized protein